MKDDIGSELPASLRELWNLSGPILRFRILRDLAGLDESYVATAHRGLELLRHPDVEPIILAQMPGGLWGDFLTTELAVLHLCEMGLEHCRPVELAREKILEPTLLKADALWEFEGAGLDEPGRKLARRIVRDKCLRMLCRSSREDDPALRPFLEQILVEWDQYLKAGGHSPTADGFAAVCLYPWDDDDFPRVQETVASLAGYFEAGEARDGSAPPLLAAHLFRVLDKWQYLSHPPSLFHDLELAATLGVARELASTSWMLDELEARQDADGLFRFPEAGAIDPSWYFPLEKKDPAEFYIEFTFRAELILKQLAYDV